MKSSAKKAKGKANKQEAKRRSQVTPAISEESSVSFETFLAEWESRRGRQAANAPSTTAPSSVSSSPATANHSPMTKMRRAFKAAVSRQPTKKRRVEERTAQVLHQDLESESDVDSEYSPSATEASSMDHEATTGHSDGMDTSQISNAELEQCGREEDSLDDSDCPPPVSSSRDKTSRPSGIRDDPTQPAEFYMGPDPSQYSTHMSAADREHEMAFRRSHADSVVEFLAKRNQDARDAQESPSSAVHSDDQVSSNSPTAARGPESSTHVEFANPFDTSSDSAESSAPSDSEAPSDNGAEMLREALRRRALAGSSDQTVLWDTIKYISGRDARRLLFHEIIHRLRHRYVMDALWKSDIFVFDKEAEALGCETWMTLRSGHEDMYNYSESE